MLIDFGCMFSVGLKKVGGGSVHSRVLYALFGSGWTISHHVSTNWLMLTIECVRSSLTFS